MPPEGVEIDVVVDWLELEAFFAQYPSANIDDVISSFELQNEEPEDDIAERDGIAEDICAAIEAEVNFRAQALGEAYPFALSADGEVLEFLADDQLEGASTAYLVCLILSHVTRSPILQTPPNEAMVRSARKRLFQIISTLAAAGHARGGAISLGWPREKKETIIEVVARATAASQTGAARAAPDGMEPKGAKDGGLDVLAWTNSPDGPPCETFYFVQAASGHNWKDKSSEGDAKKFLVCYFDVPPQCNRNYLTICPFRVSEHDKKYQQLEHGLISDRTRAPAKVLAALNDAAAGNPHIDEVENFPVLAKWLKRYRKQHRATA